MQPSKARPPRERLYFAYSPILDPSTFEAWRKGRAQPRFALPEGKVAEAAGLDFIFDFPSPKWGGRIARLTSAPGQSVFGKLLEIRSADWPLVQDAEGAQPGDFVELPVRVTVEGKQVDAIALTPAPSRASTAGPVSESYAHALARGAKAAGLPAAYVARLEAEALILEKVQAAGRRLNLE